MSGEGLSGGGAFLALTAREWRRFVRQPSRVLSAFLTAGLFWVFLGSGLARVDGIVGVGGVGGAGYSAYLVPGVALMVVMFSTVFASIGLIQDRAAGFLSGALVSPAPMWSIAGSKAVAGGLLAGGQGALVLGGVYLVGPGPGLFGFVLACSVMVLAGIGVCGVGLSLAWRMSSVSGFHGVMNGVLLPMWALSGALFPAGASAGWVSLLMGMNPLAWAHRAAAGALGVGPAASWWEPFGVAAFAVVSLAGAVMTMDRRVG